MVLELFWNRLGFLLGSFSSRSGIVLGVLGERGFAHILRMFWHGFGIVVGGYFGGGAFGKAPKRRVHNSRDLLFWCFYKLLLLVYVFLHIENSTCRCSHSQT